MTLLEQTIKRTQEKIEQKEKAIEKRRSELAQLELDVTELKEVLEKLHGQ